MRRIYINKILILLLLIVITTVLSGCNIIQNETQEEILQCLEDNGYIDLNEFSFSFEEKSTSPFVYTINYSHVFEDDFGDEYVVEIYPKKKDEGFYRVNILEDATIQSYEEGTTTYQYVKDYDIKTELKLQKQKKEFSIIE